MKDKRAKVKSQQETIEPWKEYIERLNKRTEQEYRERLKESDWDIPLVN